MLLIKLSLSLFAMHATAAPPCAVDSPIAAAKLLRDKHAAFYDDPTQAKQLLSPKLLSLLVKDRRCSEVEQCAIGADPWTGAQDGEMVAPITYTEMERPKAGAMVKVCYRFSLYEADAPQQCTTIVLKRDANTCWRVDDVQPADGSSLRRTLEDFDYPT